MIAHVGPGAVPEVLPSAVLLDPPLDVVPHPNLLYTSGTTGKPKAILHTHGGHMVGVATTLKWVFDIKEEDRWWCAADPGWIDIATSVPLMSTDRAREELGWVPRKDGVEAVAEAVRGVSDRTRSADSPHLGGTRGR